MAPDGACWRLMAHVIRTPPTTRSCSSSSMNPHAACPCLIWATRSASTAARCTARPRTWALSAVCCSTSRLPRAPGTVGPGGALALIVRGRFWTSWEASTTYRPTGCASSKLGKRLGSRRKSRRGLPDGSCLLRLGSAGAFANACARTGRSWVHASPPPSPPPDLGACLSTTV